MEVINNAVHLLAANGETVPEEDPGLKYGRLALSLIVFISYTSIMIYVLLSVKFRLDCQAYFTMMAFFGSIGVNLVYSIVSVTKMHDYLQMIKIPSTISDFVIVAVFYQFIYQLRIVRLRLECNSFPEFKRKLNWQRIIWFLIYGILSVNLILDIAEQTHSQDVWSLQYNIALLT